MSQFYAYDFIYDDVPSHKFGLKIITFEDGGVFNGVGSSDVEIISQRVLRKSKPYFLGRTQPTVLEFPLTFGTAYPISGFERDLISKWLFGRAEYKKLYILQDDLNGAYFKCFMTKPQPIYIGGVNYAFTCSVTCDSPWAYGVEHVISGSVVGLSGNSNLPDYYVEIYNGSSEDEYLYPIIEFTFDVINMTDPNYPYGAFVVQNLSENGIEPSDIGNAFIFQGITYSSGIAPPNSSLHYVKVDNDLQIVEGRDTFGTTKTGILQYFNKKWLRLVPGLNKLGFMVATTNDVCRFKIRWTERMKIGG